MTQMLTDPAEQAAETKRQATAAFVVAIDLAKAGGLTHAECHEAVDSRPHVEQDTGAAALVFIEALAGQKAARSPDEYGLTAERMIEMAGEFVAKHSLERGPEQG